MADLEVDIKGIAKTQEKIYEFSAKLGDRVTLLALRAGANDMLKSMRQAAPKKTGRLRRAIRVKTSRINRRQRNGKIGIYISINPGKNKRDQRGAYYGQFQERGWKSKKNKIVVKGRHFMRNTFNSNKERSLRIIVAALEQGGRKLAMRL